MSNDKNNYKEEHLNKVEYSIRSSQALYQYGVGGMVDFKNQTLMTASAEFWNESQLSIINDERLAKTLKVNYFKMPGQVKNSTIKYVRFPRWYFCPSCKRFKPIEEWQREYKNNSVLKNAYETDEFMVKHMNCPRCHHNLVVTRLVTVCSSGHIHDFPWVKYVHAVDYKRHPLVKCEKPELKFKSFGSTGSYANMIVECSCGARASLAKAFDKNIFKELEEKSDNIINFKCPGLHQWKHETEKCENYPITQQRGGTSVYYPFVVSSLVIPPYSDELTRLVEESSKFSTMVNFINDMYDSEEEIQQEKDNIFNKYCEKIAQEINRPSQKVLEVLQRKYSKEEQEITPDSIQYKVEEYEALTGSICSDKHFGSDFVREEVNIDDYKIPFVKQISLITKIKEVRVQTGFTRISPPEKNNGGVDATKIVSIKSRKMNWYPAYQVFGEGIFIELNRDDIEEWIKNNPKVADRANLINNNYKNSIFGENNDREITPRFLLIHTLSHLLIKQLSFECGYNIASLSERLYCSEKVGDMAGLLIYTSNGDSEGTLGGLVRQGRYDTFPRIFQKALEGAVTCSNDPVCSLSGGQGRDAVNLAACYSCSLIPETSCEEFNCFLDRGVLVGTFDDRNIGLYSDYVYGKKEWPHTQLKSTIINKTVKELKFTDGTYCNYAYAKIWEDISQFVDEEEKIIVEKLMDDKRYDSLEKPVFNSSFIIKGENNEYYTCDLLWKNKKVCLFTNENKDDYLVAKHSDYVCLMLTDKNIFEKLFNSLKG